MSELQRLRSRFDQLFSEDGLTNIKFFIDRRKKATRADFVAELNKIQDTISAGDFEVVENIDLNRKTRRFNESF